MNTNSLIILLLLLFQEEKQLLKLCRNKYAPVRAFTALLDKIGVRLNIHDKVYIRTLKANSVIVLFDSSKVAMAVYPVLFHCRRATIHSGWSANVEGVISLTSSYSTELRWTWQRL